jgi:glycerate dehydrogenase
VCRRLQDATMVLTNRVTIGETHLALLPKLKYIGVAATGYECIDVNACRRRGVIVTNVRDWCNNAVAEHVFALILALRRQIIQYREAVAEGQWQQSQNYGFVIKPLPSDLRGSTLGLLGYGSLGKTVANLAETFGMQVLIGERKGATPRVERTSFEQVLEQSDVVSLHFPLTSATTNSIGAEELKRMRPNAILINTARGNIVDEQALASALLNNELAGAALDVLSVEPPQDGNVLLSLNLPNLILTPHMAWASTQSVACLADQVINLMECFFGGKPQSIVN